MRMNPSTLLTKAIRRAERRGFDLYEWWEEYMPSPVPETLDAIMAELLQHHNWEKLLFSPTFARSLWGEDEPWEDHKEPVWAGYLSSLAAAEPDLRIRYLQ